MYEEKKKYLSLYREQKLKIDRLKEMMEIHPEQSEQYLTQIRNAEMLKNEIERKIEAVDGGVLSELLYWKYICGRSLPDVSCHINYSERHTDRLHKKALEKFTI